MTKKVFGSTRVSLPVIGQGTWNMELDPVASVKALQRGIELGMSHIDTAEMYGSGAVEQIVGQAISGRREEVFLVSKVLPTHARFKDTIKACEQSLKNLRTDYLDVYLLHWRESTPLEETFRAFDKLREDGKIRWFGVSNFDVKDMKEAVAIVGHENIVCNQVLYHLNERTIEDSVIPYCGEHGIGVVAYSPLAQGNLQPLTSSKVLTSIASMKRATPSEVVLSFLTRFPNVFAIPKASKMSHVEENARAMKVALTTEEIDKINQAFPKKSKRSLPMI